MTKAARFCIILLLALSAAGCIFENDLGFQVRFDKNPGLKAEDPVIFEGNPVGAVGKVTYTEKGDYLVDLLVKSEFKNTATADSSFYIEKDPKSPDKFVLLIEQATPGGEVIDAGALVEGSVRKSFINRFISDLTTDLQASLEKLKKEFEKSSTTMQSGIEKTINSISAQFQYLKKEVSQAPQREEVKQLGKTLNQLYSDMLTTEESVRTKIQTEIIPQIEKELEALKKRLQPSGREEEMVPLESELDKIKKV